MSLVTLVAALLGLSVWATSVAAASRSIFFPHMIHGMGFETRLVLRNASSAAARAEPSGLQFQTPVVLQFQVPVALQGRLPQQLPLAIYNPLTRTYESTGFRAVLNADGTALTASVTHFTVFVILQPFTPFAAPNLPSRTPVFPLGLVSVEVPVIPGTTPPTVTIDQAAGQADPTNVSPINFTAMFSEPVTGFTDSDVGLDAPAGATATVTGGPTTFNVAVSGMTNSGAVTVFIAAGVATDLAGNPNTASTSTDNTVAFSDLTTNPTGDFDGDALTNAEELTLGTNPVITDTDGDGFPDGMETQGATDPLDPGSKPAITHFPNEALSARFSVLNTIPPVANPQLVPTEADSNAFSILNTIPPVANPRAAPTEADSVVFSVCNNLGLTCP